MEKLYLTLLYLLSLILIIQERKRVKRRIIALLRDKKGWLKLVVIAILSIYLIDGNLRVDRYPPLTEIGERIGNGTVLIPILTTLSYSSYALGFNGAGKLLKKALISGLLSGAVADIIKVGSARGRPRVSDRFDWLRYDKISDSDYWSFPSGHVALAGGSFFSLYLNIRRKWKFAFLIPPILTALSRMASLSHWPSDVIFSLYLGMMIAKEGVKEEGWER